MNESDLIRQYLETENTSYALLINGKWGSGKTHFWKNEVVDKILRTTQIPGTQKDFYKPVYVSLYGVQTLEEINKTILLSLLKLNNKNKAVRGIASIGSKLLSSAATFFKLGKITIDESDLISFGRINHCVLAFDDIERVVPTDFVEKVLGYINYFSEHEKVKVLILTDEIKLIEYLGKWSIVKEKIVSQEISFKPDYHLIFKNLISSYSADPTYQLFLTEHIPVLQDAFERSLSHNLRSLTYGLALFKGLFPSIAKVTEINKIMPDILYSCLAVSFEYKSGELSKNDPVIPLIHKYLFSRQKLLLENNKGDKVFDRKYHAFFEKYFRDMKYQFIISPDLYHYIVSGLSSPFIQEQLVKKYHRIDFSSHALRNLNLVKRFESHGLEDHTFSTAIDQLLADIKAGSFDLYLYPEIFRLLKNISGHGILQEKDTPLFELVMNGMDKATSNQVFEHDPLLEDYLAIPNGTTISDQEEISIRDKAITINREKHKERQMKDYLQSIEECKKNNFEPFLNFVYTEKNDFPEPSIFSTIPAHPFFQLLSTGSNKLLFDFNHRLELRYRKLTLPHEKEFLRSFYTLFLPLDFTTFTPLKGYYLKELKSIVKSALDQYEKG